MPSRNSRKSVVGHQRGTPWTRKLWIGDSGKAFICPTWGMGRNEWGIRKKWTLKFFKFHPQSTLQTSTDGFLTIPSTSRIAKKPGPSEKSQECKDNFTAKQKTKNSYRIILPGILFHGNIFRYLKLSVTFLTGFVIHVYNT